MGGTEGVGGYIVGERVSNDYGSGYEDIKGGEYGYGDGDGYGDGGDGATGPVPLEEGGVTDVDGLPRGTVGIVINLAGGGTNYQGGNRLPCNWPGRGGVEAGDGHSQYMPHHLH